MKKKWLLLISVGILVCALAATAWASEPIKLIVNGQEIKPDVSPQIIDGRTMVPVRWITEALGAEVEWDAQNRAVIIRTNTSNPADQVKVEKAAVIKLVEDFGQKMKNVSLLAPEDIVSKSLKENYSEFVTPALLAEWQRDLQNAPGRLTSSPWPERIEVLAAQKTSASQYQVKGEIIEVTSVEMSNGGYANKRPITMLIEKPENKWLITSVKIGAYQNTNSVVYLNTQYGFSFELPQSWLGYTIVSDQWEGFAVGSQANTPSEKGPLFSIRHPQWSAANPRQDIPIMVFTLSQWNSLQQQEFHIGAAPIGPKELSRNSKYVFALPARYNFAFPTGYEEVEKILESNPLTAWKEIIPPEIAKTVIEETADKLIYALSAKDAQTISELTHPVKGVRFTPYTHVVPERDLVFSQEKVKGFFKDQQIYMWGNFDGTGDDIKLTPSQYYGKFVYSNDYINAEEIGYNKVLSSGNMLENQFEIYKNSIVVEYYFPGFNPDYAGMDWRSLRLVFEPYQNDWKLVGIISNQWTI